MKLEDTSDISDGGAYGDVVSENLVRLYDFTTSESEGLADHI